MIQEFGLQRGKKRSAMALSNISPTATHGAPDPGFLKPPAKGQQGVLAAVN